MTTLHDPTVLPADIPAPQDDGAARHLTRTRLPSLPLAATDGAQVDLSKLAGRTVVYIYPRTGVPFLMMLYASLLPFYQAPSMDAFESMSLANYWSLFQSSFVNEMMPRPS